MPAEMVILGDGVRTGCARSATFPRGKIPNEVHKNLLMAGMEINFLGKGRFTWGLNQQVCAWMERAVGHVKPPHLALVGIEIKVKVQARLI